jgi:3-oxoacyl-[acyl-carrier-protein] synthase-3
VVVAPLEGRGTMADLVLLGFALRGYVKKTDVVSVDGGPATTGTVGHLRMAGNQVFRHAVVNIAEAITAACLASGIEVADVDWFVPHQANQRIIKGVGDRLGLDENKVISTVAIHANTSAASIPLALDAAIQDGRIKRGDLVLLEAMGGGLTWGACAFRL